MAQKLGLKWFVLLAVMGLGLYAGGVVRAEKSDSRKEIALQYQRWSKAYVKNDLSVLLGMLSPDFTLKTETGKVLSRQKYEAILHKRKPKTPQQLKYTLVIEKFSVKGTVATVFSKETQEETDENVNPETLPSETHVHIYLDRWVKIGKIWKMQYSETLKELSETKGTHNSPETANP